MHTTENIHLTQPVAHCEAWECVNALAAKSATPAKQGATHTPGPWKARQFGGIISIDAPEFLGVAFVNPIGGGEIIPCQRDRLNARLIAAAPELLWELTSLVEQIDGTRPLNIIAARALIARLTA